MYLKTPDPVWYDPYNEVECVVHSIIMTFALGLRHIFATVVANIEFQAPYCLNLRGQRGGESSLL